MKKILIFAVTLMLLTAFLVGCQVGTIEKTTETSTSTDEIKPPVEGVAYEISEDGTYAIAVGYEGTEAHVVIADTYSNLPVLEIADEAFISKTFVSILIPDSITVIGVDAFAACENLIDVNYTGSADQWAQISIGAGNDALASASMHYNYGQPSSGVELPDDENPFD